MSVISTDGNVDNVSIMATEDTDGGEGNVATWQNAGGAGASDGPSADEIMSALFTPEDPEDLPEDLRRRKPQTSFSDLGSN